MASRYATRSTTRAVGPPGLLTLPAEIVIAILKPFCSHCNPPPVWAYYKDDLLALSLVCKTLRAFAQPLLFHRTYTRHTIRLARALALRPDLAAAVQWLDVYLYPEETPTPADAQLIGRVAREMGFERSHHLDINRPPRAAGATTAVRGTGADRQHIVFEIALALTPNLQRLPIGPATASRLVLSALVNAPLRPALARLPGVDIHGQMDYPVRSWFAFEETKELVEHTPVLEKLGLFE
jgi:hypothetical protein